MAKIERLSFREILWFFANNVHLLGCCNCKNREGFNVICSDPDKKMGPFFVSLPNENNTLDITGWAQFVKICENCGFVSAYSEVVVKKLLEQTPLDEKITVDEIQKILIDKNIEY